MHNPSTAFKDCCIYRGFLVVCAKKLMGTREVNLEPWQAEALDRAVFELSTLPGESEG